MVTTPNSISLEPAQSAITTRLHKRFLYTHAMKFLFFLFLTWHLQSFAQLTSFATWIGDSSFEATLFNERDHCPSGFKVTALGKKKAAYLYVGCWRLHSNNQRVEVTKTHMMNRLTLTITAVKAEMQSIPFSSFKVQ